MFVEGEGRKRAEFTRNEEGTGVRPSEK